MLSKSTKSADRMGAFSSIGTSRWVVGKWTKQLPASFWVQATQQTVTSMTAISTWTMDPTRTYTPAARATFLGVAYHLVAAAPPPHLRSDAG